MLRVSVRLLSGPVLQPIRDSPDDLADRVPMPAHLKALGYRANNVSSQAHASLGVVGMGGCRASVAISRERAQLATYTCRDACEKRGLMVREVSWDIFTLREEADLPC